MELEGDNKVGSQDERLPVLTIRDMDPILEVNLIAGLKNNLKLHEVLSVLMEEGVEGLLCSVSVFFIFFFFVDLKLNRCLGLVDL